MDTYDAGERSELPVVSRTFTNQNVAGGSGSVSGYANGTHISETRAPHIPTVSSLSPRPATGQLWPRGS
jgi:hypothetical protein